MDALTPLMKEYGLTGAVLLGCIYIIRLFVVWLLERVKEKDNMLEQRHMELININSSMLSYIEGAKKVNEEMIAEIRGMSTNICNKIDGIGKDNDRAA